MDDGHGEEDAHGHEMEGGPGIGGRPTPACSVRWFGPMFRLQLRDGPRQAIRQGGTRLPPQLSGDASGIQGTAALFTGHGGGVFGVGEVASEPLQMSEQAVDRGLDAGADVENTLVARAYRQNVGVNHVVKENKIARLPAIAVDAHGLAVQEAFRKHGDHAGFAAMTPRGAVHVGVTQGKKRQTVHQLETAQVVFAGQFGDTVRRDGPQWVVLVRREMFLLSVNGAAAGSEYKTFDTVSGAGLQKIQKTNDVDGSVMGGISGRLADADLRGVVGDYLGFFARQHLVEARPSLTSAW